MHFQPLAQTRLEPAPGALLAAFDQTEGWLQDVQLPDAPTAPFQAELFLHGDFRTVHFAPFSLRGEEFIFRTSEHTGRAF